MYSEHRDLHVLTHSIPTRRSSDLRRWGIDTIVGENGLSIYDYWREGFQTFQGMTAHNFPNMFFTGFTQASFNASNSKTFIDQGFHIGYIAKIGRAHV